MLVLDEYYIIEKINTIYLSLSTKQYKDIPVIL
jgi:hypothetical protein